MRLMVIVEAATMTGPAKNLVEFCRTAGRIGASLEPLIVTFRRGQDTGEFESRARAEGIGTRTIFERGRFDGAAIGAVRALMEEWKPDIIETHAVKSHFVVAVRRRKTDCPWVAFHHGYTYTDFKMRLYNEIDRWSLPHANILVTVSEAFKRQLVDRGVNPERIAVLQNAIDPGWVERVRCVDREKAKRGLGLEGCQVILAVGRMSLEKAHSDLITAFHGIRGKLPMARLVLVGDGPERERLEQAAGEGVIFAGHQSDVSRFFAIADVMVLPSLTEGSPNVLLEAMACGVPSVATEVGGVPEIVSNEKEALLVPARAPDQLAAAIGRILSEPELRVQLVEQSLAAIQLRHLPEPRTRSLMRILESARN